MIDISYMKSRSAMYHFLSGLIMCELKDEDYAKYKNVNLASLFEGGAIKESAAAFDEYFKSPEDIEDLAVDYAKTLLGAGIAEAKAAFCIESIYTSAKHIIMQEAWVKMHELITNEGIRITNKTDIMEDHLSSELEYMAHICNKEEQPGEMLKAQRDFIETHLINWVLLWRDDVIKYSETKYYPICANLIADFIVSDYEEIKQILMQEKSDENTDEKAKGVPCSESYTLSRGEFDRLLEKLSEDYDVYAPALSHVEGWQDKDSEVRYKLVKSRDEIINDKISEFSPKELIYPISQVMFRFEENKCKPTDDTPTKDILIFARVFDINGTKRLDKIFLENGYFVDSYYKARRDHVKFVLMESKIAYDGCFCASMGANKCDESDISMAVDLDSDDNKDASINIKVTDKSLLSYLEGCKKSDYEPKFLENDPISVRIPRISQVKQIQKVHDLPFWSTYNDKCIQCGKCNTVCPTCSCYETADFLDQQNARTGERRRVWCSCMLPEYSKTAGGFVARPNPEQTMRFKTLHKIYDYNKRFGGDMHMCVGCGRCITQCPEDISFFDTINTLSDEVEALIKEGE